MWIGSRRKVGLDPCSQETGQDHLGWPLSMTVDSSGPSPDAAGPWCTSTEVIKLFVPR